MPTASTAKTTTTRKRRTRKTTTPKSTAKVIKEIQAVLDAPTPKSLDKVSSTSKSSKLNTTPVVKNVTMSDVKEEVKVEKKVRPTKTNLTYVDYIEDAKVRWSIHSYETNELWSDVVKLYNKSVPVVVSAIDYVKVAYNRAFNEQNKDT